MGWCVRGHTFVVKKLLTWFVDCNNVTYLTCNKEHWTASQLREKDFDEWAKMMKRVY